MGDESRGKASEDGSYVLLYVYRVPKQNHDALVQLKDQLVRAFVKHGTLRSDFYQLTTTETFAGFASIAKTISAQANEEVWVEIDYYRGRDDRDRFVENTGRDASLIPLFRQLAGIITGGYGGNSMGEFARVGAGT